MRYVYPQETQPSGNTSVVVLEKRAGNAPIHKSKAFKAKINKWRQQDLYVFFLPAYSLELNIIETLLSEYAKYILSFVLPQKEQLKKEWRGADNGTNYHRRCYRAVY